jgi:hypothetical protein
MAECDFSGTNLHGPFEPGFCSPVVYAFRAAEGLALGGILVLSLVDDDG